MIAMICDRVNCAAKAPCWCRHAGGPLRLADAAVETRPGDGSSETATASAIVHNQAMTHARDQV